MKKFLIVLCILVCVTFSSCFKESGTDQPDVKGRSTIMNSSSATGITTNEMIQPTSKSNIQDNEEGTLYKDNFYEKQFENYDEYKAIFRKITSFKSIEDIINIEKDDLDYFSKGNEISLLLNEKYFVSMKLKNNGPSYIKFHLTGAYVSFEYLNYISKCDITLGYMTRKYTKSDKTECESAMDELHCTKIFTTKDNCKVYRSPNLKMYEWFKDGYDTEFILETEKSNIDVKFIQKLIESIEYEKIAIEQ